MSEMTITREELANNTARRTLVCLVVDNSYSMTRNGYLQTINERIRKIISNASSSILLKEGLEMAVVAGDEKGTVVQPLNLLNHLNFTGITPHTGFSTMIYGVQKGIEILSERLRFYRSQGISSYAPLIYIISDGENADARYLSTEEGQKYLDKVTNARMRQNFKIKSILVSDTKDEEIIDNLRVWQFDGKYSGLNALDASEFNNGLSREISEQSKEMI